MTTEPKDALYCLRCVGVEMCTKRARTLTQSTQIASCDSGAKSVCRCASKSIRLGRASNHKCIMSMAVCGQSSTSHLDPAKSKCFMTALFVHRRCTAAGGSCAQKPNHVVTTSLLPNVILGHLVSKCLHSYILDIFLCHKSETSDGQFWIIHFHGQSIHMCKDSFSGEQRCCFNSMPNTFCFIVWRALIFRVLAKTHDQQQTVILGMSKMHTPQTVRSHRAALFGPS